VVVLTSNRTREVHDALKRRCLYHWIDHPGLDREVEIVRSRAPEVSATLARQVGLETGRLGEGAAISLYLFPVLVMVVYAQLRFVRNRAY
jgi:hypothetical protein